MTYTFDEDCFSDLHKDAFGFRPRGDFFQWLLTATDDEKQAEWDSLLKTLKQTLAEDARQEKDAIVKFEALVTKTVSSGARDVETAHRWIMEASDCNGDWEYLCFHHGIPYGYFKKAA